MLACLLAAHLGAAERFTYWIEPCTPATARQTTCDAADSELARWALNAWARESDSALVFAPAPDEDRARLRIHWVGSQSGLYGETEPLLIDGQRGANIYVLPSAAAMGSDFAEATRRDHLFRDAIVYLTLVHESGHALGLDHTRNFEDIMYSFGFGGDILEYFSRYRRLLRARNDIQQHSGISAYDRSTLRLLHH